MEFLSVSVGTLVRRHPWAREVLEWHGVDLDQVDPSLSLSGLCWLDGLSQERVVRDLVASHPEQDWDSLMGFLSGDEEAPWLASDGSWEAANDDGDMLWGELAS